MAPWVLLCIQCLFLAAAAEYLFTKVTHWYIFSTREGRLPDSKTVSDKWRPNRVWFEGALHRGGNPMVAHLILSSVCLCGSSPGSAVCFHCPETWTSGWLMTLYCLQAWVWVWMVVCFSVYDKLATCPGNYSYLQLAKCSITTATLCAGEAVMENEWIEITVV